MQWLLLESRDALLIVLGLIEFVLLVRWARRRTRARVWWAAGGLLMAAVLLLLQAWVVTDRERIAELCHALAQAAEDADAGRFGTYVAGDFSAGTIDRAALLERLERAKAQVRIRGVRLSQLEVQVHGDRAEADFQARCRVTIPEVVGRVVLSRWKLRCRREGGDWRVTSIRPVPAPGFPFQTLEQVLRW